MVSVGNASSVMAFSLYSNMKAIYILRFVSICLFIFSILLFLLSMVNNKLNKRMSKILTSVLTIALCISIICSTLSVVLSYNSKSIDGYDSLENGNYTFLFPYYDDMKNKSDEIYTLIDEISIYSSKYVCLQSSFETKDDEFLYDVNYFESKNNTLLGQFIAQQSIDDNKLVDKGKRGKYSYCLYKNDISYSVTFITEESYFVLYLLNYNFISKSKNTEDIIDNAYNVFRNVKENIEKGLLCKPNNMDNSAH